jgi:hypothetical protein
MIEVDVPVLNMVEICCWMTLSWSQIYYFTLFHFVFAFSYQHCMSNHGILQINLYHCESKAIWKVSNHRLQIMILRLIDLRAEASTSNVVPEG